MADIAWPADLAPYRVMFYLQPHVGGAESPLTRTRKVYGLSAPRWLCRYVFRGGYDGDPCDGAGGFGPRLDGIIADMEGGLNRVALWDFRRPRPIRPQSLSAPDGLINVGAAAAAAIMGIAGFTPNSLAFSTGDYVGGDGRAHIVTAPCRAGDDGVAMVSFRPPLSVAVPAGSAAVVENVASWFRVTVDEAGSNETEVGQPTPYTLDFTEDLG